MVQYDVLLSMPPRDKPNAVKIINITDGSVLWNVQGPEKVRYSIGPFLKTEGEWVPKVRAMSCAGIPRADNGIMC